MDWYVLSFHSADKDSTDHKYKFVMPWLIEQEVGFNMVANDGARTLLVYMDDDTRKRFLRQFTKFDYYLD